MSRFFDPIFLDIGHDDIGTRFRERGRNPEANARSGAVTMAVLPEMSIAAPSVQ